MGELALCSDLGSGPDFVSGSGLDSLLSPCTVEGGDDGDPRFAPFTLGQAINAGYLIP